MQDNLGLIKYVLPEELFHYFEIKKIEQEGRELHLYLKEVNETPTGHNREALESNGFHNETVIKDFPIRETEIFFNHSKLL